MKRKKYPSKNDPTAKDISCEKVQNILEEKAKSDNKTLLKNYTKEEILLAQLHIPKCKKCLEKYRKTKERSDFS